MYLVIVYMHPNQNTSLAVETKIVQGNKTYRFVQWQQCGSIS